jgi:hypothetical protein
MRSSRSWLLFPLLVLVLVAVACGGGTTDSSGGPTPSPTAAPSSEPTDEPTPTEEPSSEATTVVAEVFFLNEDRGDPCSEVFGVERRVSATTPLREVLDQLLAGPTASEIEDGYEGWFSADTAGMLDDVSIEDDVAYASFDPVLRDTIPNASTSCGSGGLLAQLDATTTQFPTVDRAVYSLGGDVDAFYEWLQLSAPQG